MITALRGVGAILNIYFFQENSSGSLLPTTQAAFCLHSHATGVVSARCPVARCALEQLETF